MNTSERLLSVAEVFELVPGTEGRPTWVDGFTAKVENIKSTFTRVGGEPMQICTLKDLEGSAVISMTLFECPEPPFHTGDTIEVFGGGIRRTEFRGLQQVTITQKTEIHCVRRTDGLTQKLPLEAATTHAPAMSDRDAEMLAIFAGSVRTASGHKTPIWEEALAMLAEWKKRTGR